jgi:putative ABC transport system substrate-binding protein
MEFTMRRREFIAFLAGAAAYPAAARAQSSSSLPRVGVLMAGVENSRENAPRIAAFLKGLNETGWKDGENVRVIIRWSGGKSDLIKRYADEIVANAPDVIVANSTSVIDAFKERTDRIPVVFALAMDPVGLGHVESLSRPGRNFTGFTFIDPEIIGKWMAVLKDTVPTLKRGALLFNPKTIPTYTKWVGEIEASRQPGAIELVALPADSDSGMEAAIAQLARQPDSCLIFGPDPFNQVRIKRIAELAVQNRLPTISVYRSFPAEGGLMAYGPDTADVFHRSASYVDRVLKGAKPADLPVQQPTKFELVINVKTAKALGIEVPAKLLFTADEVIE